MSSLRSLASLRRCAFGRRGYATLLLAEHNGKALNKVFLPAITAASKLPGSTSVDVLVLGKGCSSVAEECASLAGVDKVILAESDQFEHAMADTTAECLHDLQKARGYTVVAGVSGAVCKEVLPRLGAKLDVQPLTEIIAVDESEDGVFTRPMYAGNALATVKSTDAVRVLSFRSTAFSPAESTGKAATVETFDAPAYAGAGIQWVSNQVKSSDKPQLSSAGVVVSGGRALKSGENFETVLEPLCDKLGAAMGASRAAVDAGFVPNELQVGQTGKVVAPDLYFAVGISGAIQHLSGMKDSKTIVAINKDADAPIFQVADYGLVADLFEAVPELTRKV